ncbi:hypothetical protein BJX66DRAFT_229812 [Aspergillus keveii]|uniref:Uncharacterized protein n=1 Tax=Aspergillus keveii TaxID=714993 RepID=A0ABR4GLB2_9EURO
MNPTSGGKRTLLSSGENSPNKVSRTTLRVSTSSRSLRRLLIKGRKAPDATDAGYIFAKLLNPCMAARRSSSNVALCSLLLSVLIVSVAVCLAGACDSRIRNIATGHSIFHGHRRPGA